METSDNNVREYYDAEGVATLLLKIWTNREESDIELNDIIALPDYYDLVKSSNVVYDLVGQHIYAVVFGHDVAGKIKVADWLIGFNSNFHLSMKTVDLKMRSKILKAIEILSRDPEVIGAECMPLPQGPTGQWYYKDGDLRLVYELNETNKRLTLLSCSQENTNVGEGVLTHSG